MALDVLLVTAQKIVKLFALAALWLHSFNIHKRQENKNYVFI